MLTFCANQASFLDGIANGRRAPASFSLTGNGDSLVSDGRCKQYTAPRTLHTRNFFSRVAQVAAYCSVSKTVILARMSCFAPCLILHLSRLHSALRPFLPCFIPRTGQIPVHRNKDSCLAVLPSRLRSNNTWPLIVASVPIRDLRILCVSSSQPDGTEPPGSSYDEKTLQVAKPVTLVN